MKDLFRPLMVGFEIPHIGSVGTTQMLSNSQSWEKIGHAPGRNVLHNNDN